MASPKDTRMTGNPRSFDITIPDPKARIEAWIKTYENSKDFESEIMRNVRILDVQVYTPARDAIETKSRFEFTVIREVCSGMLNMHGGAVATLTDMVTTMAAAPLSQPGWWEFGGVSRTLQVTFVRPIRVDTTVLVECVVRNVGKRLSVIQCVMTDKTTGSLLALGDHGKAHYSDQVRPKKVAEKL